MRPSLGTSTFRLMLTPPRLLLAAYVALAAAILLWNIAATGRIVYSRRVPQFFAGMTALGALLIAPALIVAVSAASIVYGRAIHQVAWLWPAVTLLFALQAFLALARGLVHPLFGIPVLVYDGIIAAVAITRYCTTLGVEPPYATLVLSAAMASALGVVGGTAALAQANWLLVPLFAPALPSRSGLKRVVRTGLAAGVTLASALIVMEIPGAVEAIHSYARYEHGTLQERPEGDLSFGLTVFPELRSAPPPIAVTSDLDLADSIGVDAISVLVAPEATHGRALDSLAHIFDDLRSDSTTLIVTLGYPERARTLLRRAPDAYLTARLRDVDRLARALHPTILIPAYEPYGEGARALGLRTPAFWTDYIRRAAAIVHHVNPNIKVGVAVASYGPRDSTVYAWAAARRSPVDVLGFSLLPGFNGATSLDTHLRIAQRWMRQLSSPKPHWIWATGGYPVAHGERSQLLALRGVLAWASTQESIQGIVVAQAGDYDTQRGLRAPGGRLRPAFGELVHDVNVLRESAAQ